MKGLANTFQPQFPFKGIVTAMAQMGFNPKTLFANNEPGVWYDPSDLSTLFQDTAGTTPVTAVEQPVGLMLDKSKGFVLGPELVTNGTFDTDINGWIVSPQFPSSTAVEWSNGALHVYNTQANYGESRSAAIPLTIGKQYVLEMDILEGTTDRYWIIIGSSASNDNDGRITVISELSGTSPSGYKRWRYQFVAAYATAYLYFATNKLAGSHLYADNISVRELPGNHAFQTTATSRPVLSARYNIATATEALDSSDWGSNCTRTVTATPSPLGALYWSVAKKLSTISEGLSTASATAQAFPKQVGKVYLRAGTSDKVDVGIHDGGFGSASTATLSGPGTLTRAGGSRWSVTGLSVTEDTLLEITRTDITAAARLFIYPDGLGSVMTGRGVLVAAPQLVSADLASLPYQRVNTATDYDTAGFPHYLRFDGVDDWLVTNTITPGIDKVQVFAGVRKLSDAVMGSLVFETSGDSDANAGATYLLTFSDSKYYFRSGGSNRIQIASQTLLSPITNVLAGIGDISGDSVILRVNGAQAALSAGNQGTGNFLAYPLYIGRRAGTSIPFNGHIYSLIVRFGSNLPIATIEKTEKYINSKTRAH